MEVLRPILNILLKLTAVFIFVVNGPHAIASSPSGDARIVLSGQYQTSGGQANYTLPITVSPGRAAHQPQLGLAYRSNGNSDVLGMGWSLRGVSAITRCGQDLITDHQRGGIRFDAEDRYCLDGQRLIAITGSDGGNLTEYRTKKNGYAKVVSYGRNAGGPEFFKVWTQDGRVREYGHKAEARATLPKSKHAYQWLLNSDTDASGENTIQYQYSDFGTKNGVPLIKSVVYAGGKVTFEYKTRSDVRRFYLGGDQIVKDRLMSTINTFDAAHVKVGTYQLTHKVSSATSRTLLERIQYCTLEGCSSSILFDWQSRPIVEWSGFQSTGLKAPRFYDEDRDGQATAYGVLSENTQTGKYQVKDLQGNTHSNVASFTLKGKLGEPKLALNQCKYNLASSYVNGKGEFTPYCQFSQCTGNSCQYSSNGLNAGDIDGDGITETISGFSIADFNGDGIDDKHRFDVVNGGYAYEISGGLSGALPSAGSLELKSMADVNRDGYLDVIMGPSSGSDHLYVYLFTGNTFTEPTKTKFKVESTDRINFADINGDGYPELVAKNTFYQNLFGEISETVLYEASQEVYSLQDINGDGWVDILSRGSNTANVDRQLSVAHQQDKLTKVTEHGVSYTIRYLPATDSNVYTQGSAIKSFPYQSVTPAVELVYTVEKQPQGYAKTHYQYHYAGALSHLQGGGFLGFATVTETEIAAVTTRTETEFEQEDLTLAGSVKSVRVIKNGKKTSEATYQYHSKTFPGYDADYYQTYANQVQRKSFTLGTQIAQRIETITRNVDRFGNVTKEVRQFTGEQAHAGSYTQTTVNQYLSPGQHQNRTVYQLDRNSTHLLPELAQFKAGFTRYCSENGEVYFKANDLIVLIGMPVTTPILAKRNPNYYRLSTPKVQTLDDRSVVTGHLSTASKAEFDSANLHICGQMSFTNQGGKRELQQLASSVPKLVTESGGQFWTLFAPEIKTVVLKDNSTGLSRTTKTQFDYHNTGFMKQQTVLGSDYESGALASKSTSIAWQYDKWGNTKSETLSGTGFTPRITKYEYDPNGLDLTYQVNAKGHRTGVKYNARGLLFETTSALKNRISTFGYDSFERVTQETLPGKGNTSTTDYKLGDACSYALPQTVSCTIYSPAEGGKKIAHYDYAGREIRQLHQGFNGQWVSTDTHWDISGRKTQVTRPYFIRTQKTPPFVTFSYDVLNREISKSEPDTNGNRSRFTTRYDGLKTETTDAKMQKRDVTINVMGYILRKNEPLGAFQTYRYYPDGKLRSSSDSKSNTTHVRYDSLGFRSDLNDPDMGVWHYQYNALGELTYKRDVNGAETRLTYDSLGRKLTQQEGGQTSRWVYDENGAQGTLSRFTGHGNTTEYAYDANGLTQQVTVSSGQERLATGYSYDGFERLQREIRPNGGANNTGRLEVEYVYNPYGYQSAVRSPRSAADDDYSNDKFIHEIRQLLRLALEKANGYLTRAERYQTQAVDFKQKAQQLRNSTINEHQLDAASVGLLGNEHKFAQWCNTEGDCYLKPMGWVIIGVPTSFPIEAVVKGPIYRLDSRYSHNSGTQRVFSTSLISVTKAEFSAHATTQEHDFVVKTASNGQRSLYSEHDVFVAQPDDKTKQALVYTADDLDQAAKLASQKQKHFAGLADKLISLSEQVAQLSGIYCQDAKNVGGKHVSLTHRWAACDNAPTQFGQADELQLMLTQAELEASVGGQQYIYYWQRRDTDAYNHTLSEVLGNGLVNTYEHNANTGRAARIQTTNSGKQIRSLHYRYDQHNNVKSRFDEELGITDNWQYDALDRVKRNTLALADKTRHGVNNTDLTRAFDYRYDSVGNIEFKTGIGGYTYSKKNAGPHAVTQANGLNYAYDAAGNMQRAWKLGAQTDERTLTWTAFNKPESITRNGKKVEFFYDANHNRYRKKTSDGKETFYFGKSYEKVTDTQTGEVQHQHFIYADGKLIALNTQTRNANNTPKQKQVRYLHYDALNSVDLITDGYANVVERRSYDTWGKQRKVSWRNSNNPAEVLQQAITNRGYTGHEAITEVGLIHMNGRVYDPELGRFTSADPYIQAPFETNSFNRYSYVWNNPLKYTDPTGYKTFSEWASDAWDSVTDFFSGGGSGSYTNNGNSDGSHANYGYTTYKNGNGFAPSRSVDISWGNDLGFIQGWNSDKCVGSTCTDAFVEAFSFTGLGSVVVGSYDAMHDISDTLDLYSNDKISAGAFGTSVATSIGIAIVERKLKLGGEVAESVYDRVTKRARRNGHLAGGKHPKTGIPFDKKGHPDFSSVSKKDVEIEFTGSRRKDVKAANEAGGYKKTPEGHVWHHHQDGTTMQLVPRDIHTKTGHDGGFSGG